MIKPADRGGRIVVLSKDLHIQEGNSQLLTDFYQILQTNPTKTFNKTIITSIKEEINNNNLPTNASKLYLQHPRTSDFYMLPKIHKPYNRGCPIKEIFQAATAPTVPNRLNGLSKHNCNGYLKDSNSSYTLSKYQLEIWYLQTLCCLWFFQWQLSFLT